MRDNPISKSLNPKDETNSVISIRSQFVTL
jgi:hypothetical protein